MSLLPESIKDENNLALEQAMLEGLKTIDLKKILLCPLNNVSDDILNILAREYHITGYEGYNLATTRKEKEDLIDNSIYLHSKKGAKPALIDALKNLGLDVNIQEWAEYGGKPAHFRINYLNIFEKSYSDEFHKELKNMIDCYKPATRKLDSINYFCCNRAILCTFSRIKTVVKTSIKTKEIFP